MDHKIQIFKHQHDMEDLKRQVDNARMKLATEIKVHAGLWWSGHEFVNCDKLEVPSVYHLHAWISICGIYLLLNVKNILEVTPSDSFKGWRCNQITAYQLLSLEHAFTVITTFYQTFTRMALYKQSGLKGIYIIYEGGEGELGLSQGSQTWIAWYDLLKYIDMYMT